MTDDLIQRATVYSGETLLLRWGDSHKGRTVTLQLDPVMGKEHPFKGLKCGENGQRVMLVAVLIGDDEQPASAGKAQRSAEKSTSPTPQDVAGDTPVPVKKAKAFKDRSRSQQAALKLQDPSFCLWLAAEFARKYPDSVPDDDPNENLLTYLCINSKTRLDVQGSQDARAWDALLTSYDTRAYVR